MKKFCFEKAWTHQGWVSELNVTVDDRGYISNLGDDDAQAKPIRGMILPGIPNLHSHAFQRAAAGLTEHGQSGKGDTFWTWRQVMHRFVQALTPEDQEAIAAQLYVEMLKAGYTAVGEFHYLHRDPNGAAYADPAEMAWRIAAAAGRAGIGLTLLPVLYSVGGYGGAKINHGQRRFVLETSEFLNLIDILSADFDGNPQLRVGVAPHSVRQVPADKLHDCLLGIAEIDATAPIHIHVAEQIRDVEEHLRWAGARPVNWLLDNAEVDDRWCLIHATHLNEDETCRLATTGAVAGLCPTTEANLGDGLFPLAHFLEAGGRWGVGSDCNISVSAIEELRWLEYGQRLISRSRNITSGGVGASTGARLVSDAVVGGAQALGRPIGAIEVDLRADFIVLDADALRFHGRNEAQWLDALVFADGPNPIRDVMVGGEWVIRNGHHADEIEIERAFRAAINRLS